MNGCIEDIIFIYYVIFKYLMMLSVAQAICLNGKMNY